MAMGRQKDGQGDLMVSWSEMPRSPGHVFYDRLQSVLVEGGFDAFAEASCRPYYAARMGAPSMPPGRYFRMHLVGYFEGIDSERGLEWRCSDSLSLRAFLRLGSRDRVPDHSWLSRSRTRLPHEVHATVFDWVLVLIAEAGLIKGERIGVDASTMEANAALRNIVRRDNGEGYREMLERLARESGVETPTAEDLARLDRKRKGKKLSNTDWVSKSGPEAKIAKMKDGTTHLAYKPEHAVDLDTGAVVAAELHPADEGDTTTLSKTLAKAAANLEAVDAAPTPEDPAECVADKGYHSRAVLRALNDSPWKTRIAAPKQTGFSRWHGDEAARRAVTNNRARLKSGVAREAFKLRAEIVERCFAHNLDRGGMRRTWLRGRENVHRRYLLHVAGHNLSLLMRQLIGANISVLAAIGVRRDGQKVLLSIGNMGGESQAAWRQFLDDLDARGLKRPGFVIVDGAPGLEAALSALWGDDLPVQRCTVHKHRNLLGHAPKHMHDELSEDYRDMIYADTASEVETRRKAFVRKWRLKCRAVQLPRTLVHICRRSPSPHNHASREPRRVQVTFPAASGMLMAGCQHRADGRQPSPGEGRRCDRRTHPFIRLPQLIELLKVQPEFARRPKTRPGRSAVLPITEQRTFRSSVIRLTGTSIRQHRSAALIPSTSRFSQSSLPE